MRIDNKVLDNKLDTYKADSIHNRDYKAKTENTMGSDKLFLSEGANDIGENYDKLGKLQSTGLYRNSFSLDKGTAAETTIIVNRSAFDAIVHATTYGEPQWEELGCDDEKRWVVINGQRFEVPHSEEEKEMRRKMKMTLIDILDQYEKEKDKYKEDLKNKENIECLKDNKIVLDMLKKVFNEESFDGIIGQIL